MRGITKKGQKTKPKRVHGFQPDRGVAMTIAMTIRGRTFSVETGKIRRSNLDLECKNDAHFTIFRLKKSRIVFRPFASRALLDSLQDVTGDEC